MRFLVGLTIIFMIGIAGLAIIRSVTTIMSEPKEVVMCRMEGGIWVNDKCVES